VSDLKIGDWVMVELSKDGSAWRFHQKWFLVVGFVERYEANSEIGHELAIRIKNSAYPTDDRTCIVPVSCVREACEVV
jgi:hypothetical protein